MAANLFPSILASLGQVIIYNKYIYIAEYRYCSRFLLRIFKIEPARTFIFISDQFLDLIMFLHRIYRSNMRRISWPKLKSPFGRPGRSRKESVNSLSSKSSVNEEYTEALRTKSYIEIWNKAQGQLGNTSISSLSSSSSTSLPLSMHLSEYLLEPRQETLVEMMEAGMNLHHLLIDFFEASLEACKVCELLLQSIHQTRVNYKKIQKVIKLSRSTVHDRADDHNYTDKQCRAISSELAAFLMLKNPLLNIYGAVQFRDIRDGHVILLRRLTSKYRKIKRRERFRRIWKKICGTGLFLSQSALLILLLICALHGMVGIVAAPAIFAFSLGLSWKKRKGEGACGGLKKRLSVQLDVAAKGVYILINDFDTMSRVVKRLNDEVEHRKIVADMCVRNGKSEILKEVVREFHVHESSFLEQLEEFEEHIYLCFLTINRSRSHVIQEIMAAHQ